MQIFKNKIILVVIGVIALLALYWWSTYNGLVKSSLAVDQQWSQVESQYQRRYDLIPNLVNVVQGVMKQEKDVFLGIAEARKAYAGAGTVDQKVVAAGQMDSALSRLLVVMEQYPMLKSNENALALQTQLEGTENRIATERMRYNEAVTTYNTQVSLFPGSFVARMSGFAMKTLFKSVAGADKPVPVKF